MSLGDACSPAGVFKHVAHDGMRHPAVVVAHADVGPPDLVTLGDLLNPLKKLVLT